MGLSSFAHLTTKIAISTDTAKTNNSLCSFVINLLILSLHDFDSTAKLASSYNSLLDGQKPVFRQKINSLNFIIEIKVTFKFSVYQAFNIHL